jgi:hypothetical protein
MCSTSVRVFAILHFYNDTKPFQSCEMSRVIDYDWNFPKNIFLLEYVRRVTTYGIYAEPLLRCFGTGKFPEGNWPRLILQQFT